MAQFSKHEQLLQQIRGQSIVLPDYGPILSKYPFRRSLHYSELGDVADKKIDSLPLSEQKRTALKTLKADLMAAETWPAANLEQLKILTYWTIWVFAWDNEMDYMTGKCTNDLDLGEKHCKDCKDFVAHHLGFRSEKRTSMKPSPLLDPLAVIWDSLRDFHSVEQRTWHLKENNFFIDCVRREQEVRLADEIPTVEDFLKFRLGSGGGILTLTLIEYALGIRSPRALEDDPLFKELLDEGAFLILNNNDILSFKHEIQAGQILNIVPLHFAVSGDLQNAVDESFQIVLRNIARVEELSSQILSRVVPNSIYENETRLLVQAFQDSWVGNLRWHFENGRYGVSGRDNCIGGFKIDL